MQKTSQPTFDSSNIRLIIGLGNPGTEFYHTRHNIGFRFVDHCAETHGAVWRKDSLMMHTSIQREDSSPIILVKPLTFMNKSGSVIPSLLKKGITPEQILIVYDEMEKKFGNITITQGGSAKGHNGVKSIMTTLPPSFWRLKFGIGRPESRDPELVGSYVLGKFSREEELQISELLATACKKIR